MRILTTWSATSVSSPRRALKKGSVGSSIGTGNITEYEVPRGRAQGGRSPDDESQDISRGRGGRDFHGGGKGRRHGQGAGGSEVVRARRRARCVPHRVPRTSFFGQRRCGFIHRSAYSHFHPGAGDRGAGSSSAAVLERHGAEFGLSLGGLHTAGPYGTLLSSFAGLRFRSRQAGVNPRFDLPPATHGCPRWAGRYFGCDFERRGAFCLASRFARYKSPYGRLIVVCGGEVPRNLCPGTWDCSGPGHRDRSSPLGAEEERGSVCAALDRHGPEHAAR